MNPDVTPVSDEPKKPEEGTQTTKEALGTPMPKLRAPSPPVVRNRHERRKQATLNRRFMKKIKKNNTFITQGAPGQEEEKE